MKQHVIAKVRLFAEAAAADVTLEGPRAVVHVHVALEVSGGRERLGAQRTLVRLLLQQRTQAASYLAYFRIFKSCDQPQ